MPMLVLNRRYDEEICLEIPPSDKPVFVKIAYLGQSPVNRRVARIGVQAPKNVPISRGEVYVADAT